MDLQMRKNGIGGSEVAAILGLAPPTWPGPLQIYAEKLGLVEPKTPSMRMRLGNVLEGFIVAEYQKEKKVFATRNEATYQHPRAPHRLATPDAFVGRRPTLIEWGLECKSVSSALGWGDGTDEIPPHYLCQVHWYIAVMSDVWGFPVPHWDVAVLIGKDKIRYYRIGRDEDLEAQLLEAVDRFWSDHVVKQVVPPATSPQDRAVLAALYQQKKQQLKEATPEEEDLVKRLHQTYLAKRQVEEQYETLSAMLMQSIGEEAGIQTTLGKITWKQDKDRKTTDWKAVAEELDPPAELVERHTTTKPGSRRFLVPREWTKEG